MRLTPNQAALLDLIAHCKGLSLYGPREFRTAKSLEAKGLIHIDTSDYATLRTPAAQPQSNGE